MVLYLVEWLDVKKKTDIYCTGFGTLEINSKNIVENTLFGLVNIWLIVQQVISAVFYHENVAPHIGIQMKAL